MTLLRVSVIRSVLVTQPQTFCLYFRWDWRLSFVYLSVEWYVNPHPPNDHIPFSLTHTGSSVLGTQPQTICLHVRRDCCVSIPNVSDISFFVDFVLFSPSSFLFKLFEEQDSLTDSTVSLCTVIFAGSPGFQWKPTVLFCWSRSSSFTNKPRHVSDMFRSRYDIKLFLG